MSIRTWFNERWAELLIGLMITVFLGVVDVLWDVIMSGQGLLLEENAGFKAIVYLVGPTLITFLIADYRRYGRRHTAAVNLFRRVFAGAPVALRGYVEGRYEKHMRKIEDEVRRLQGAGLSGQNLVSKLEILASILPYAFGAGHAGRYWATSLDLPSDMWRFQPFFDTQRDHLSGMIDKRRLVVIPKDALAKQIEEEADREALSRFVEWHLESPVAPQSEIVPATVAGTGVTNSTSWDLRFLLGERKDFLARARHFFEPESQENLLTDFAIVGDRWIYGELGESAVTPSDPDERSRTIRLHEKEFEVGGEFIAYERFFSDIWNYWMSESWPVMTGKQVWSECWRRNNRCGANKIEECCPKMFSGLSGSGLFSKVVEGIAGATTRILAVDIAPVKGSLDVWLNRAEYREFLQATITAAEAQREAENWSCGRIYVLKNRVATEVLAEYYYDLLFEPQIRAGVKVYLGMFGTLSELGIPLHDFIVADEFCFGLGWGESFSKEQLTLEKNIEVGASLEYLVTLWEKLRSLEETQLKCINEMPRPVAVSFLLGT